MANELRVQLKLTYNPASGDDIKFPLKDVYIDQTGVDFTQGTQSIGFAAEEVIAVSGDIATQGFWIIENLDATNFVLVGLVKVSADKDAMPVKILPGKFAFFSAKASGALYAMADTAAVTIRYTCFEV